MGIRSLFLFLHIIKLYIIKWKEIGWDVVLSTNLRKAN